MKRIGLIDIGSNSMRLVLVRINSSNSYKIIDELKETIRLGEDMDENSNLHPNRIDNAVKYLKIFKNICDSINVDNIIAVATEAVRKAPNKEVFLEKVKKETGIEIRVLSGEEEAYYDYLGVIHSMDVKNTLIMDIGGSSAEFILVIDKKIKHSISLPFGAINITKKFNTSDAISPATEKELADFFYSMFKEVHWLNNLKIDTLVGVGGSIRNIGKIHKKLKSYPLNIIHNYKVDASDVIDIFNMVKTQSIEDKKKIKGLSKERSDIFTGACAAVCALINFCDVKSLSISGNGLREGLLYEYLTENNCNLEDVLDFSITNLIKNLDVNENHSNQIYNISNKLFQELKDIMNIEMDMSKILKTASMLHDCGVSINYYGHHLHSFYIIINSRLYGLSHRELLMSAYIASFHRKEDNKINILEYKDLVSKEDVEIIKKIGALLNISEYMCKNLSTYIEDVICYVQKDTVLIKTVSKFNFKIESSDCSKVCSNFKKVFKKDLLIL